MPHDEYHLVDVDGVSVTVHRQRITHAIEWEEPGRGRLIRIYQRPNEVMDVLPTGHLRSWLGCPIKSAARRPL
jgi:hypothetical protein